MLHRIRGRGNEERSSLYNLVVRKGLYALTALLALSLQASGQSPNARECVFSVIYKGKTLGDCLVISVTTPLATSWICQYTLTSASGTVKTHSLTVMSPAGDALFCRFSYLYPEGALIGEARAQADYVEFFTWEKAKPAQVPVAFKTPWVLGQAPDGWIRLATLEKLPTHGWDLSKSTPAKLFRARKTVGKRHKVVVSLGDVRAEMWLTGKDITEIRFPRESLTFQLKASRPISQAEAEASASPRVALGSASWGIWAGPSWQVNLKASLLNDEEDSLTLGGQRFAGVRSTRLVDGQFTLTPSLGWQIKDDSARDSLQFGVLPKHPAVLKLAESLFKDRMKNADRVAAVAECVALFPIDPFLPGAGPDVIAKGTGDEISAARLAASLLLAGGVKARVAYGFRLQKGFLYPTAACEWSDGTNFRPLAAAGEGAISDGFIRIGLAPAALRSASLPGGAAPNTKLTRASYTAKVEGKTAGFADIVIQETENDYLYISTEAILVPIRAGDDAHQSHVHSLAAKANSRRRVRKDGSAAAGECLKSVNGMPKTTGFWNQGSALSCSAYYPAERRDVKVPPSFVTKELGVYSDYIGLARWLTLQSGESGEGAYLDPSNQTMNSFTWKIENLDPQAPEDLKARCACYQVASLGVTLWVEKSTGRLVRLLEAGTGVELELQGKTEENKQHRDPK